MTGNADSSRSILEAVRGQLKALGIDLDASECAPGLDMPFKVLCVSADMRASVDALGESSRDRVVMVRVDDETINALDAWVETGQVKSRSAAAALFIREGLKIRERELGELEQALQDVEDARTRLKQKARAILGADLDERE